MKSKQFFRGLGVGIIVTALLLCIFYRKEMSDNAIISKAKAMGMEFVSKDVDTKKQQESEVVSQGAVNPTTKPKAKPTVIPTNQPTTKPTIQPTAKPTIKPTAKPTIKPTIKPTTQQIKKPDANNTSNYTNFTIKQGLLSNTIAKQMELAGIVDSGRKFDRYLVKNGYSEKIRCGNFKIPKKSSYAQIAKIITS